MSLAPPQLLVAHVRFTIAINTKAREQLICEFGLFDKVGVSPSPHAGQSPVRGAPASQNLHPTSGLDVLSGDQGLRHNRGGGLGNLEAGGWQHTELRLPGSVATRWPLPRVHWKQVSLLSAVPAVTTSSSSSCQLPVPSPMPPFSHSLACGCRPYLLALILHLITKGPGFPFPL